MTWSNILILIAGRQQLLNFDYETRFGSWTVTASILGL